MPDAFFRLPAFTMAMPLPLDFHAIIIVLMMLLYC